MKEQIQLLVQSKSTQERITAVIELYLTNEPREPLEIKITSWDNMLLLFNSRISQAQVSEMCAKLLMANLKAEKLPELLQKLIQTKSQTSRSFYLVAEDASTYFLQITDTCDDQQFPRFSLPTTRCDFEKVAKHLQEWLKYYRKLEVEMQNEFDLKNQSSYQKETDLTMQLKEISERYDRVIDENSSLQGQLAQNQTKFERERADLTGKVMVLERDFNEYSTNNKELQSQNIDLTSKNNQLVNDLQLAQIKITELVTSSSMSSNQIQEKLSELSELKQNFSNLKQNFDQLTQENTKLALQIKQQDDVFADRLTNSSDELKRLFGENASFKLENQELQQLSQKLAESLQKSEVQKDEFYNQKSYLENQLSQAITALNDVLGKNEQVIQKLAFTESQLVDVSQKYERLTQDSSMSMMKVAEQGEDILKLEAKIKVLSKQVDAEKQRADDAEQTHGKQFYKGILENNDNFMNNNDPADIFLRKNRDIINNIKGQKPSLELSLDDMSVCSEYKQYLVDQKTQNSSTDLQQQVSDGSIKSFDMSKYLNKISELPKPNHGSGKQQNVQASDSVKSRTQSNLSMSNETKSLVNKYMKGQIQTQRDLDINQSSTSEDLIFKAMNCVRDNFTDSAQQKQSNSNVVKTQFDLSCKGDPKSDDLLAKFVGMLDEELE